MVNSDIVDVDPHPLIITALILVESELDAPWPVEIYSHVDNIAHNITMNPGLSDFMLYI